MTEPVTESDEAEAIPPDVTGAVLLLAVAATAVAWFGHEPGTPMAGVLLAGAATGLSVAAWATAMWSTREQSPVVRVGGATVASTAAVATLLAARQAGWPLLLLAALVVTARLERPPGRREWRHAAIVVAVVLGVVVGLGV
jgi:hypothetical protein